MGYMFSLTRLRRKFLPACHPDFAGAQVWQHWFVEDEDLLRCEEFTLHEKKNANASRDVFTTAFKTIGVNAEATTEVSKETLLLVIQELVALVQKIQQAKACGDFYVDQESQGWYGSDELSELQALEPVLQNLIDTFDFEEYVLIFDWA